MLRGPSLPSSAASPAAAAAPAPAVPAAPMLPVTLMPLGVTRFMLRLTPPATSAPAPTPRGPASLLLPKLLLLIGASPLLLLLGHLLLLDLTVVGLTAPFWPGVHWVLPSWLLWLPMNWLLPGCVLGRCLLSWFPPTWLLPVKVFCCVLGPGNADEGVSTQRPPNPPKVSPTFCRVENCAKFCCRLRWWWRACAI
jgi:hypothetical protein